MNDKKTFYQNTFTATTEFDLDILLDSLNEYGGFVSPYYDELKIEDKFDKDYANIFAKNTTIKGIDILVVAYRDIIKFYAMATDEYHTYENIKKIDNIRDEMASFRIFEERY